MKDLLLELIPNAPKLGLYTAPEIPPDKLSNALSDYAAGVHREDVLALYDATLLGNAKDGAVFTATEMVFQNNALEPAQTIRYDDLVHVEMHKRLLGGRRVQVDVNSGRASVTFTIDFSGKSEAAEYVSRFLQEAMLQTTAREMDRPNVGVQPASQGGKTGSGSDIQAVSAALGKLLSDGKLSDVDHKELLDLLKEL